MADICMCDDKTCPSSGQCYRFNAKPDPHRQTYFLGSPRKEGEDKCEYFWEVHSRSQIRRLDVLNDF